MVNAIAEGLENLFTKRSEFILVGLTGRTGSGCTTSANLLSRDFSELQLPDPEPNPETISDRKYRIIYSYTKHNWHPFFRISVTDVIASFLLEKTAQDVLAFITQNKALKSEQTHQGFLEKFEEIKKKWTVIQPYMSGDGEHTNIEDIKSLILFWSNDLQPFVRSFRLILGTSYNHIFQIIGDNLRRSGDVFANNDLPEKFYEIPERVARLVIWYKKYQALSKKPAFVVLDALRNPYEILFFRERFASFYVIALNTENADRESRLQSIGYDNTKISALDEKEYPEKNKPLSGYKAFVSQNIQNSVEKADIHIHNPGRAQLGQELDLKNVTLELIKYVSLIRHPGLVTPTKIERCMQVAFSAKANSGCISRQVGAVVADENFSIKAIGWNDVPYGQVPCLLRQAQDIIDRKDVSAFSDYEFRDVKFNAQLKTSYRNFKNAPMKGRLSAFCFKDQYNELTKQKNQVHTRSLHAEENAFLQISKYGGQGIEGGILFSTASPCELCSKKAYQLGVKHIYYIDPYPGISITHILSSGSGRPMLHLFSGAIGQAYHRLYDPVMPFKDEIDALRDSIPQNADLFGGKEK